MFIDANLLVLLVVGSVSRSLIRKHRRTRNFVPEQYDALLRAIEVTAHVIVTPNTLTEACNLLKASDDARFLVRLRQLIEESEEVVVESREAAGNPYYLEVGLADAVLLEKISPQRPLVTADAALYQIASTLGEGTAFNIWHFYNP
ncbi:MAG: hypothetical protein OXI56_05600 [bacterium]|nr:hypothetical protein [bacterium]